MPRCSTGERLHHRQGAHHAADQSEGVIAAVDAALEAAGAGPATSSASCTA